MLFLRDIAKTNPLERRSMFAETEEEARARRSQQIVARFEQKQLHGRVQQQKKETRVVSAFVVALAAVTVVVIVAVLIEGQIVSQTRTPAEDAAHADPAARQAAAAAVRRLPPRPPRPPPSPSRPPQPHASPSPPPSPSPLTPSPLGPPPSPAPSPPPRPPGEAPLKQRTCSILIHGLRISLLDNHRCEDGGTDSVSSVCALGTDYGDCNPR